MHFVMLQIPTWKRNILRLIIVLIAGSLAVLLKDNFAYVGAFVGKCMYRIVAEYWSIKFLFFVLSISLNMCFGCSKDLSFEHPQHMFWLRNKKNNFLLHTLFWRPGY